MCVLGFQDPDLTEVPRDSPLLHNGTNCKEELLSNTAFLVKIVVDVQRHDREGLLAITRLPTKSCF